MTNIRGFDNYKEELMRLDIDEMEKISGVDRELVRQAAIAYASAPNAMSFHGLGVTEHSQGTFAVMQIADLALITGNIGRKGVGVNPLRGQNNVQGSADMGVQPHQGAGYLDVTKPDIIDKYASQEWPRDCLDLAGRFPDFPLRETGPAASADLPRVGF